MAGWNCRIDHMVVSKAHLQINGKYGWDQKNDLSLT
jgi:hypothetical protein